MRMKIVLLMIQVLLIAAVAGAEVQESFIVEPIFNTKVRILEAGREHRVSLLLVHGVGPEGAEIWRELLPELAENYHVVTCDLPGFGRSEKPNLLYSPEKYSDFLAWLTEGYIAGDYILAGHSLGGALSLHYAATARRKPDKLILIDAAGILHRAALTKFLLHMQLEENQYVPSSSVGWFNRVLGAAIEKLQNAPVDLDLVLQSELLRQQVLQGDSARIAGLALVQTDFTDLFDKVETPTFLLWGEDDEIAPLRTGQLLAARLPLAQLELIADGGHVPMRRQPAAFRQSFFRALQTAPFKLAPQDAAESERIGSCEGQDGMFFSGNYHRIELNQCRNVRLVDVFTEQLIVVDSDVNIQASRIVGAGIGIDAVRSRVIATALDIVADLPIRSEQSSFDFAGAVLEGRGRYLIEGSGNPSRALFSVSRGSTSTQKLGLHQVVPISPQQPFPAAQGHK